MKGRRIGYLLLLVAFAMLPLAGCSGGGGVATVAPGEKGVSLTVAGTVDGGKSTAKTVGNATDPLSGTVSVLNAADSSVLGTAPISADGKFSGLSFTLTTTKAILVFKAVTNKSATPFYTVVPLDLSEPPAPGITASNAITILINQASTNIATTVSTSLALPGVLGEPGSSTPAGQAFSSVAQLVTRYGGQILAYNTTGLALTGSLNDSLLPAQFVDTLKGDDLKTIVLDGKVTNVSIPGGKPIVSFQITNKTTGKGIRGLKTFGLAILQLKPGTSGSPDEWQSYMVSSATSRPGTDSGYTVIDNGDGSYTAVFGTDIKTGSWRPTYNAEFTHRVAIQVYLANYMVYDGGNIVNPYTPRGASAPTTSSFSNPLNILHDFVPSAGGPTATMLRREIVTTAACNDCHTKIGTAHTDLLGNATYTTPHGGRVEAGYCVACHTTQRANGRTASTSANGAFSGSTYVADGEVLGNQVTMIHKIHMGSLLDKTGYDYAGVKFNNIHYPVWNSVTNCRQCHKQGAGAQGDNWQTRPSRQACGSCHDNVNFAAGTNTKTRTTTIHKTLAFTDDSQCLGCHGPTTNLGAAKVHMGTVVTANNPNVKDGLVNFTYEISDVTVNASNQAVITFRIMQAVSPSTTPAAVVLNGTASAPLTGFTGGPTFLLAYYLPTTSLATPNNNQAAATSPDYNNLGVKAAQPISVSVGSLLGGTTGTLGTPDSNGYYTATVTAAASNFPLGAKMRSVSLQGYFTQAGTTNITGTSTTARPTRSVVKAVTGDAVRRTVIDSNACAKCHENIQAHGNNRVYDVQVCVVCHVPNLSSSGKGANQALIDFIATQPVGTAINLTNPLGGSNITGTTSQSSKDTMLALIAAYNGSDPTVFPEEPQNMKDLIHGIHAGSSRNSPLKFVRDRGTSGVFNWDFSQIKYPGLLKDCTTCHTPTGYTAIPAGAQVTTDVTSPTVTLTTANNVVEIDKVRKSLPNANDLVTTPFAAACVTCHDSVTAKAHMEQNGGQIRVLRSSANPARESCVTCHGPNGSANIVKVHKK